MTSELERTIASPDVKLTLHALMRFAQRGFRDGDVDLVALIGTEVAGGYLVLRRDVADFERNVKILLEKLRRLIGKRLVVAGNRVVTGYHAEPRKERDLLRGRRCRTSQHRRKREGE